MKLYVFYILCSLLSISSYSQGLVSGELGANYPIFLFKSDRYRPGNISGTQNMGLAASIKYLRTDTAHPHFYWGTKLSFEQFSFVRGTHSGGNSFGASITHKSSYLVLAPVADFGLGRWQEMHIHFLAGVGYRIYADEKTDNHFYHGSSSHISSSQNVSRLIYKAGIGISQHIYLTKAWDLTISEGGNIMIGNLTTVDGQGVHPGSLYLTAGITRVFKRVPVPEKVEKKPFKSKIY